MATQGTAEAGIRYQHTLARSRAHPSQPTRPKAFRCAAHGMYSPTVRRTARTDRSLSGRCRQGILVSGHRIYLSHIL